MKRCNLPPMREEYLRGLSISQLAEKYHVSATSIRTYLLKEGVLLRKQGCPQNRKPIPLPMEDILDKLNQGWTYQQLAEFYKVCKDTIGNRVRNKGQ